MSDEYISADKLYKILHYSKRKTKYLLDNEIIPSIDTGKKTWRYQIKMSDVEYYLKHKRAFKLPVGIFNAKTSQMGIHYEPVDIERLLEILSTRLEDYPDALTVSQAAEASLFSIKALCDAIASGKLHAEKILQILYIPKQKLQIYLTKRLNCGRLPLCKLQMKLLNKIMEERVNDEGNGRKNND